MTKYDRSADKLKNNFTSMPQEANVHIYTGADDKGVRDNNGRAGARYAPEAILNILKNTDKHQLSHLKFYEHKVNDKKIDRPIKQVSKLIQLGGGHDHIYPFAKQLAAQNKQLTIINFDAHLDTRIDNDDHSGTPFRLLDSDKLKNITLIQYGIHDYTNSLQTFTPLSHINMLSFSKAAPAFWECIEKIDGPVLFSLDADALSSSAMEAVSAVNYDGVELQDCYKLIRSLGDKIMAFGVYEYNPIYDNLSQKGARNLVGLIREYLK